MSEEAFRIVPLDLLVSARFQSHFPLNESDVQFKELVDSIKAIGIKQPLLVRILEDGKYEIVAGERRFRAASKAGLNQVPVLVEKLDDLQAAIIQGVENIHRQDYSEAEKSRYLAFLAVEYHLTAELIAQKLDMSYPWVCRYLPAEFKNKEMAELGKKGGEALAEAYRESEDVALQRRAELAEAERIARQHKTQCQNPSCLKFVPDEQIEYVGEPKKAYCKGTCGVQAKINFENEKRRLERQQKRDEKPITANQLDAWDQRKANRSPHDSQFQIQVFTELANEGYPFEQNQKLPVFETEPDGLERNLGLLVYLDNVDLHKGKRSDTDERLRGTYEKHHPDVTVLSLPFKGKGEKEKERVKKVIREKYDFLIGKKAAVFAQAASDGKEESS